MTQPVQYQFVIIINMKAALRIGPHKERFLTKKYKDPSGVLVSIRRDSVKKFKKYIFTLILAALLTLGISYYSISCKAPELLIKETIEQSLKGNFNSLSVNEGNKQILHDFFTNDNSIPNSELNYSIDIVTNQKVKKEFIVYMERINYNGDNQINNVVNGTLYFRLEKSSVIKYIITDVQILKALQIVA